MNQNVLNKKRKHILGAFAVERDAAWEEMRKGNERLILYGRLPIEPEGTQTTETRLLFPMEGN